MFHRRCDGKLDLSMRVILEMSLFGNSTCRARSPVSQRAQPLPVLFGIPSGSSAEAGAPKEIPRISSGTRTDSGAMKMVATRPARSHWISSGFSFGSTDSRNRTTRGSAPAIPSKSSIVPGSSLRIGREGNSPSCNATDRSFGLGSSRTFAPTNPIVGAVSIPCAAHHDLSSLGSSTIDTRRSEKVVALHSSWPSESSTTIGALSRGTSDE